MNVNTDRLIEVLSTNLEPVSPGRFGKVLTLAILAGEAAALVLMLATVGPRPDLDSTAHLEWTAVKLLFALSVVGTAAPLLVRMMRPGLEHGTHLAQILPPFFAAIAAALLMLLFERPQAWSEMLRGASEVSSPRCLLLITSFAAIPMAALIWSLRRGAPTRLRLCGAIAGVVAGGLGAAAYALNCNSDTIPFIAIWYTAAIGLCAIIGSQLGPRLLRW
jgi:hypothetical protein